MSSLRTRILLDELESVDSVAWSALRARPPASLCGSKAWVKSAFEIAHPSAKPVVVTVEEDGRLVGLLALALHAGPGRGLVRFAGAPHNDLNDLMLAPGAPLDVARAAVLALTDLNEEGYALRLEALDPDGALAAAGYSTGLFRCAIDEPAPAIDLRGPWREAASAQRRKQWERKLRRLKDAHEVEFDSIEGKVMLEEIPLFVSLREERRLATGREPDLPPVPFFEAVVRRLSDMSTCAFFEMRIDGAPVARDLYLLDRPVALMWLRALDPTWQQMPCGHLLLRETAEALAGAGYEVLDLGRGAEPYKSFFGAAARELLQVSSV
jgi:CelD/BcsL family acetyltransferase involved in cellulose biosynthesis